MATDTLAVSLSLSLRTALTRTDLDTPSPGSRSVVDNMLLNINDSLTDGTVIDEADVVWHDIRTVNNADDDLDLHTSGTCDDPWGTAITMVKLKGLLIHNKETDVGHYLEIGAVANGVNIFGTPATDLIHLGPNGIFFWWDPSLAGVAVADGASDILRISSSTSGESIEYDIVIIGTSA